MTSRDSKPFENLLGRTIVRVQLLHDRRSLTVDTADGYRWWYACGEC